MDEVDDDEPPEGGELERELQVMREMIDSDPEVLRHFDTNGDGRIGGDEWQAVVDLVRRRLAREAEEKARAREILARDARPHEPPPRESGELAAELYRGEVAPYVERMHREAPPRATMEDWSELVMVPTGTLDIGSGYPAGFALRSADEAIVGFIAQRESGRPGYDVWGNPDQLPHSIDYDGARLTIRTTDGRDVGFAQWRSSFVRDGFTIGWGDTHGKARQSWDDVTYEVYVGRTEVAAIQNRYVGLAKAFRTHDNSVRVRAHIAPAADARVVLLAAGLLVFRRGDRGLSVFDFLLIH